MGVPDLIDRDRSALERMDDALCDAEALNRTYARFSIVNRIVAGWRAIYRRDIRPRARHRPQRVLDIGAGGGDVARLLISWAARDRIQLEVLGIDPDPRAIAWAQSHTHQGGPTFRCATSMDLVVANERFDVVTSNHLLHHLREPEIGQLLADSSNLLSPGGLALHTDLSRHRLAYASFALGTLPFRSNLLTGSFIREDGLTSIRRSFTQTELESIVPDEWVVQARRPFRLHLRLEPDRAAT